MLTEDFERVRLEWEAIAPPAPSLDPRVYTTDFVRVRAEFHALVSGGKWLAGPDDLMSVVGRTGDELAHSRVLAWLLDPTGRHGMGSAVLERVFAAGWSREPVEDLGTAVVQREVCRPVDTCATRADVVVRAGATVLVIENKVWSDESEGQCAALHREWIGEANDVRFLFVTRDGHPPRTAGDSRGLWRSLSYRRLAGLIAEIAGDEPRIPPGRLALSQYQRALRSLVGEAAPFEIQ